MVNGRKLTANFSYRDYDTFEWFASLLSAIEEQDLNHVSAFATISLSLTDSLGQFIEIHTCRWF